VPNNFEIGPLESTVGAQSMALHLSNYATEIATALRMIDDSRFVTTVDRIAQRESSGCGKL